MLNSLPLCCRKFRNPERYISMAVCRTPQHPIRPIAPGGLLSTGSAMAPSACCLHGLLFRILPISSWQVAGPQGCSSSRNGNASCGTVAPMSADRRTAQFNRVEVMRRSPCREDVIRAEGDSQTTARVEAGPGRGSDDDAVHTSRPSSVQKMACIIKAVMRKVFRGGLW